MPWPMVTIGEISDVVTKGTTPTSVGYRFAEEGITFVKVESITSDGVFLTEKFAHIDQQCHDALKRSQLEEGDLLFSIAGALGRTAMVSKDILPANTNQALAIIRLSKSDRILPEYVLHALSSGSLIEQIEKRRGGMAQQNLSLAQVKAFQLPLPCVPEQERIVAILDGAFAAVATATANVECNIVSARELFNSRLHVAFERHTRTWSERKLGDVCENLDSRRVPITKSKREPGNIPYYGASGIVDYVEDYLFDEDLLLVSEDGANLLARSFPIAFSISGKVWVNNHAHVLRFENIPHQRFVEYYLNSITLEPYVSGMAQPKLNQKALNSISLPWSDDVSVVEAVVDTLEASEAESSALLDCYQRKRTLLIELRQSILHKAFTGELTADLNAADRTLSQAGL